MSTELHPKRIVGHLTYDERAMLQLEVRAAGPRAPFDNLNIDINDTVQEVRDKIAAQVRAAATAKRSERCFEITFLKAAELAAKYFEMPEDKVRDWIRIGGKIHTNKNSD